MRVIAQSLLLLLAWATMSAAAPPGGDATFSAVLGYPTGSQSPATSRVFRRHDKPYRFRLEPQRDVDGNVIVFELVLEQPNGSSRSSNLLDPIGTLHGYQKWFFAASDFSDGPEHSAYGRTRSIDLPGNGLVVHVEIGRCAVKPAPSTSHGPAEYRFTGLSIRVLAVTEPIGAR